MLSNYQKGKVKRKSIQHVNYCTRERLEVLRQCNSIAPIQIMHFNVNETECAGAKHFVLAFTGLAKQERGRAEIYRGC